MNNDNDSVINFINTKLKGEIFDEIDKGKLKEIVIECSNGDQINKISLRDGNLVITYNITRVGFATRGPTNHFHLSSAKIPNEANITYLKLILITNSSKILSLDFPSSLFDNIQIHKAFENVLLKAYEKIQSNIKMAKQNKIKEFLENF